MALHVKNEEKGDIKMDTEPKTEPQVIPFEPSKLSDDDFAKIFSDERLWKNERFKELNAKAKEGEKLSKLQQEANENKLLEEKKYQELIDSQKKKIEELESSVSQVKLEGLIRNEAQKLGVIDPDVVIKLIDRAGIKTNEDGSMLGISEAVKSLTDSKPYLIGTQSVNLGTGTNPSGGGNASPRFKLSQLQDASFYQANEKEITEALKNNQVENDMNVGK